MDTPRPRLQRGNSSLARLAVAMCMVVGASACSSGADAPTFGGAGEQGTPAESSNPGQAIALPISRPASPPAGHRSGTSNPPAWSAADCDAVDLHDRFLGIPSDTSTWVLVNGGAQSLLQDGGAHPGGWRFLALPDSNRQRPVAGPDGETPEWFEAGVDRPLFTFVEVVERWMEYNQAGLQAVALPMTEDGYYRMWFTPVLLLERTDGTLDVIGRCPAELGDALNGLVADARSDGRQGTSLDIAINELDALRVGD